MKKHALIPYPARGRVRNYNHVSSPYSQSSFSHKIEIYLKYACVCVCVCVYTCMCEREIEVSKRGGDETELKGKEISM